MTEVGHRYAVCSLKAKRAEIAGQIERLRLDMADRRQDLAKVDEILAMLAPDLNPASIPPNKHRRYVNLFKQGELSCLVLGVLRHHKRPMGNMEVVVAIMGNGGFGPETRTMFRRRVRANLAYLSELGRVVKTGRDRTAQWALPR